MKDKAIKTIESLRAYYSSDRFTFETNVSMYLTGPQNKGLRVEIMELITRERKPANKCTIYAIADVLKASFEQITLF